MPLAEPPIPLASKGRTGIDQREVDVEADGRRHAEAPIGVTSVVRPGHDDSGPRWSQERPRGVVHVVERHGPSEIGQR